MNDLKIWKAIWEIRYPAAAKLFDKRGEIAARWQGTSDLTEWKIARNQVMIHNKSNTTYLRAEYRVLSLIVELPKYRDFCDLAADFAIETLETLDIQKIERIGLRLYLVAERKHFKALVNRMRKQLYNLPKEAWDALGGHPEDIGVALVLKIGKKKAHLSFGPMEKGQLVGFFESEEAKQKAPTSSLFLDLDLYQIEPKVSLQSRQEFITDFLESGDELVQDRVSKFVDCFGGFQ